MIVTKCAPTRIGAILALTAGFAFAYPSPGQMTVTGKSDYVGRFGIATAANPNVPAEYGYGGGFDATLNNVTQMMFCVDFNNDISIPYPQVNVNISTLTTGSNLSATRFGGISTWSNNFDASLGSTVLNELDHATDIQRYQMAAYLVWNYSFRGNVPVNNIYSDPQDLGIQSAIWTILDAPGETYVPPTSTLVPNQDGAIDTWLTNAANWLNNGDRSFLSNFRIVSDACIETDTTGCLNHGQIRLNRGVQEFLTVVYTPEPSFYGALALGLAGFIWRARRDKKAAKAADRSAE